MSNLIPRTPNEITTVIDSNTLLPTLETLHFISLQHFAQSLSGFLADFLNFPQFEHLRFLVQSLPML